MAEVSTLFQGAQFGKEVTPGTLVAANKKLLSFGVTPGIQTEIQKFRPMGSKFDTLAVQQKEWVQADLTGVPDYNELAYLFTGILKSVAAAGAGSAKTWGPMDMAYNAPDTVQTYSVEYGSSARAHRFTYGILTALGLEFTRAAANLTGSMLGRQLEDDVAMTGGPSSATQMPIASTHVSVYLADTAAGLAGATALARCTTASFNIANRRNIAWFLNRADAAKWIDVETVPDANIKLVVEADDEGMALLTTMRTNAKKFVRIQAVGSTIDAGPETYKLTIDLCGRVSAVDKFSDVDGLYAIGWTLAANYDATFADALQVTLINTLAAL